MNDRELRHRYDPGCKQITFYNNTVIHDLGSFTREDWQFFFSLMDGADFATAPAPAPREKDSESEE